MRTSPPVAETDNPVNQLLMKFYIRLSNFANTSQFHLIELPLATRQGKCEMDSDNSLCKKAELPAPDGENLLRRIMEVVPVGISYFDSNQRFCFVNQNYKILMGLSPDDLIGKTLEAAIGEKPYQIARPYVERALKGESVGFENTLSPQGGRTSTIAVSYLPNVGPDSTVLGFFALVEDTTEHQREEEALRERETRYRALFEGTPISTREEDFSRVKVHIDALNFDKTKDFAAYLERHPEFIAECAGLIVEVDASEASLKLHHADDKSKFLATFTSNFSDQALQSLKHVLVTVHSGETNLEFETFVVRADGSRRDVTAFWSVVPGHEHSYSRILFLSVDVTERKRAEEVLKNAHDELERRVEERTRELFTANTQLVQEIADRNKAETELRKSEARFRNFAEAASDWFWEMDENLRFSYFSDRFTEITGVPHDMLLGKTRRETDVPNVDPDEWEKHLAKLAAGQPFSDFRHPRSHPDGRIVHLSINGKPVFDEAGNFKGYHGTGSDITSQTQMEQSLRLTQFVIDHACEAAIWFDHDGRLTFVNDTACSMLGYAREELLALNVADIDPNVCPGDFARAWKRIKARGPSRFETRHRTKDGNVIPVEVSLYYLKRGDEELACSFSRDIAERKQAEGALVAAKEQAESSDKAKSEFLANMSHELRTPLNAIIGFSEMISSEMLGTIENSKYLEYASDIVDSGKHLLELIDDILDLSKIESGKLELDETYVDIEKIIDLSLTLVKQHAQEKGVVLDVQISEDLPVILDNERRLKQIVINLLINVITFTRTGGRISVIAAIDGADDLTLSVSDTGVGISPEDLPKVMEVFGQVEEVISREHQGSGLGLPLSKALAELHGGALGIESTFGVGTTVTLRLPTNRTVSTKASVA